MNQTYYDEKIKSLPENLQYAIMMSEWQKKLVEIQNKFKLHIDQTQVLENSAIKLMFGDISAADFINIMFTEGHINSEMAADILLEVDLQILKKIRETLENIESAEKDEEEIEYFLMNEEEKKARAENEAYAKYYAEVEKIREEDNTSPEDIEEEDIPSDIIKEREEMLKEISNPTKIEGRVEQKEIPVIETKIEQEIIPVDHQLQNKELEEPYHEENIIPIINTEALEKEDDLKSQIKKPININLTDIYREPIE